MSVDYAKHFNPSETPQSQPIPGRDMVKNDAGGYVFAIDKWDQFLRFLILGCEGGTYYVGEAKLSASNAVNVIKCIKEDPKRAVDLIVDVSVTGRSNKQDAILYALALVCAMAPEEKRPYAYGAISKVCRTGTQLFTFTGYIQSLRKWSRGLRNGVSKFYTEKPLQKLELQLVKYRQRNGFTHRDIMRLAHPATKEPARNSLFKYAVGKLDTEHAGLEEFKSFTNSFSLINAYEEAKGLDHRNSKDVKKMAQLIADSGLPREGVPTAFLNSTEVWDALMEKMPIGALVRNLGKLGALGMTESNLSKTTKQIVEKLGNPEAVKYSRIHPIQVLNALKVYGMGHGVRGDLIWRVNPKVNDALDELFYLSFGNVEATGQNTLLALDVSPSMFGYKCAGAENITAAEGAVAMAMINARVEENHDFIGFMDGGRHSRGYGRARGVKPLNISPNHTMKQALRSLEGLPWGGTDCALPMLYALEKKIPVDTFYIYTDNDTWAGDMAPVQALNKYRDKMGIDARVAVVGMSATSFSIADPQDKGMLDVVGFDTSTPNILTQFALGNI